MNDDARDWLDALPRVVREGVRLALGDLQRPTPVLLEKLTYEADREQAGFGVLTVSFADGTSAGFGLMVTEDGPQVTADVADRLQELFQEERAAWGEARPPCPGHPHPAVADVIDGAACWVCPSDGRAIGHIGHMSAETS